MEERQRFSAGCRRLGPRAGELRVLSHRFHVVEGATNKQRADLRRTCAAQILGWFKREETKKIVDGFTEDASACVCRRVSRCLISLANSPGTSERGDC